MSVSTVEIPLTESFDDAEGRLLGYESYEPVQRLALTGQRHADVRCFVSETETVPASMLWLDSLTTTELDLLTMDDLVTDVSVYNENWTLGTLAAQTDRNYWHGISISVTTTATSTSIGPTVDLTSFAAADTLSLAFPALPAAITRGSSFVDFTSHVTGNFTTGPTVSVPFTGLASTDVELAVALSTLAPLGYIVTAVRFRLAASAPCTFRCMAIRVLPSTWLYAPVDVNTLTGRLVRPVSRTGAAATASAFPANTIVDPQVPTAWPILLRSDTPSGADDPRPIDIAEAAVFHTGHKSDGELRLYFREYALDLMTQLDLDLSGDTQADLEALGHAIDFDRALYRARDQDDIEGVLQSILDTAIQSDLEAEPDYFTATWLQITVSWTTGDASLAIEDTEGNDYTFAITLVADTTYVLLTDLRDDQVRARIYPITQLDAINFDAPVFDSSLIRDGTLLAHRGGRVGWYARFADGNSYVESLRYYAANFAEYRSVPLRSLSPVDGGQLFYGGSPPREGFTGVSQIGAATVTPDASKSSSGVCYRVDLDGSAPLSGLTTNAVYIDNFDVATLDFSLYFPTEADAAGGRLVAYLTDVWNQPHILNLGFVAIDQLRPYHIDLHALHGTLLPGNYSLNIVLLQADLKTSFYVDEISVQQRSLIWSGRADAVDPWGDNGLRWIPFREALNGHTTGVLFAETATAPQVRAQARYQNAFLTQVTFKPHYATLGRLVWSDDRVATTHPIVASFLSSISGRTVAFSVSGGAVTLAATNWIAYYEWDFGDGETASGPEVAHTYALAGTYTVNLSVSDNQGSRSAVVAGPVTVA